MHSPSSASCVICRKPLARISNLRRTCDSASCLFAYQQHLRAGRATCMECGRPLSRIEEANGARACQDPRCQVSSRLLPTSSDAERCRVCRIRLTPDCAADGVCRDLDCRAVNAWRRQLDQDQKRVEQIAEQTRLGTLLRDQQASAERVSSPQDCFVTVVSLLPNRLAALPDQRREEFRQRVEALARELDDAPMADAVSTGEPSSAPLDARPTFTREAEQLSAAVCTACRGFCCRRGDTHAFLQACTLRRLLSNRPELQATQLADLYVTHLPDQSYSDSCVFHSEVGCTLPREMRSDTCNNYFCAGQQNLRAALERGAPPRAFLAVSDGSQIVASHFLPIAAGNPPAESA